MDHIKIYKPHKVKLSPEKDRVHAYLKDVTKANSLPILATFIGLFETVYGDMYYEEVLLFKEIVGIRLDSFLGSGNCCYNV